MIFTRRVALAAILTASSVLLSQRSAASSPPVPSLVVGQPAPLTIVATRDFVFDDQAALEDLRHRAIARVPWVLRSSDSFPDGAVAAVKEDFGSTREAFLAALNAAGDLGERNGPASTTVRFREFVARHAEGIRPFPLGGALAAVWAAGGTGEHTLQAWTELIGTRAGEWRIRADELPRIASGFPTSAMFVPETWRDSDGVSGREAVLVSQIISVTQARDRIKALVPDGNAALADYLAMQVVPNTTFDTAATERLQLAAAARVTAVEPVVRGQLIVREGELVTPRAFSMLKAMGAGGVEPAAVPSSLLWMIPIATGMAILVLWWRLGRRRLAGPSEAVVIVDDELPGVGRGAMAPSREELLALLREEFVGALVEQRRTMLNAQQRAHDELERLENRLSDLQVPLRSRLDAYEARIADLERELHRRGDENRELFQATIELMQQKVEQEKAGRPVNFN